MLEDEEMDCSTPPLPEGSILCCYNYNMTVNYGEARVYVDGATSSFALATRCGDLDCDVAVSNEQYYQCQGFIELKEGNCQACVTNNNAIFTRTFQVAEIGSLNITDSELKLQ
jgi:hypothetical protein